MMWTDPRNPGSNDFWFKSYRPKSKRGSYSATIWLTGSKMSLKSVCNVLRYSADRHTEKRFKYEKKGKKKTVLKWNEYALWLGNWVCANWVCGLSASPNRMPLTDRHRSHCITAWVGMKKSMSVHSHSTSISATESSYWDGKSSTDRTQRGQSTRAILMFEGLPWCQEGLLWEPR